MNICGETLNVHAYCCFRTLKLNMRIAKLQMWPELRTLDKQHGQQENVLGFTAPHLRHFLDVDCMTCYLLP